MKYGIMCAMESEIKLIQKDIVVDKKTTIARREFIEGKLYGADVVLVLARIGKVAAASTATTLIDRFGAEKVVMCGVAGGSDKSLNVGDVVISDKAVQHDVEVMGTLFNIECLNVAYFEADKTLVSQLHTAIDGYFKGDYKNDIPQEYLDKFKISAPKVVVGTVASGDQFVADKQKDEWLVSNVDNLKCVEMEGAAVAQVCYEYDVPYVIIRAISDSANDDACVDYMEFVENASIFYMRSIVKAWLESQV